MSSVAFASTVIVGALCLLALYCVIRLAVRHALADHAAQTEARSTDLSGSATLTEGSESRTSQV